MNHDYLLAAMILCLDVMNMRMVAGSDIPHCVITESDKLEALRVSHFARKKEEVLTLMTQETRAIWGSIINECRDAPRAVKILDTVLSKIYTQRKKLDLGDGILPVHSISGPNSVASITSGLTPQPQQTGFPIETPSVGFGGIGSGIGVDIGSAVGIGGNVDMQDSFLDVLGSPNLELPADFNWYVSRFAFLYYGSSVGTWFWWGFEILANKTRDLWDQFMAVHQTHFPQDSSGFGFQQAGVSI